MATKNLNWIFVIDVGPNDDLNGFFVFVDTRKWGLTLLFQDDELQKTKTRKVLLDTRSIIPRDPGVASREEGIFIGENPFLPTFCP